MFTLRCLILGIMAATTAVLVTILVYDLYWTIRMALVIESLKN